MAHMEHLSAVKGTTRNDKTRDGVDEKAVAVAICEYSDYYLLLLLSTDKCSTPNRICATQLIQW